MDWKTFGHDNVKHILDKQLSAGKFPHAYLFTGPEGIGKKELALEFAAKILDTDRLSSHMDFQMLDEAEGPSVEQVREFISKVSYKPFVGSYKVAAINNIDRLNVQGSNALLKTLEEPPASSIILLIASQSRVLSTIMSRCQVFACNPFSVRQLKEFAVARGIEPSEELLALSGGSIARMLRYAQKPDVLRQEQLQVADIARLASATVPERLLAIAKFAEMENAELEQVLVRWLMAEKRPTQTALVRTSVLKGISRALEDLKTNKNKKLILQGLFLGIA